MGESKLKEAGRKILGRFRNANYVIGILRTHICSAVDKVTSGSDSFPF